MLKGKGLAIKNKRKPTQKLDKTLAIPSVYQGCLRLLSMLDMEGLQDAVLTSVMSGTNAKNAALWLASAENSDEMKLVTVRGPVNRLSRVDTISISSNNQAKMMNRGEPFYEREGKNKEVGGNAFYVPLKLEEDLLGLIKVSGKLGKERFDTGDLAIAKTIAVFASIAVANAWKVKEIRNNGFRDAKTNTYHISYFTDYVAKEINKARRYQRTFSILYLKIENLHDLRNDFKEQALRETIQEIINAVFGVIRDADIISAAKDDEYYVLLPETDYFGSLMSIRRINKVLTGRTFVSDMEKSAALEINIRSVSFPKDGENLKDLLNAIKIRIEETKNSIYTRYKLGDMDFWKIFDSVVGKEGDYHPGLLDGKTSITRHIEPSIPGAPMKFEDDNGIERHLLLTPQMTSQIREVIFGEIEMNQETRGILYLGCKDMGQLTNFLRMHPMVESSATKVYLLGEKREKGWDLPAVTPVFVDSDEIDKAQFLIFLSVNYAYAVFLKEGMDRLYYGIHTSDPIFVENMIAKLQENYHLQIQL